MGRGLLTGLLYGAQVAEAFGAPRVQARLDPAEAAVVAGAAESRRREFAAARLCAHEALARLGAPDVPLLPGTHGEPMWPPGVVGSITHCTGYRACAVARSEQYVSIGIDAEPVSPLPDGVLEAITGPEERAMLTRLAAVRADIGWDRLLFSAKESVYKAWFPLTRSRLGFKDATVELDPRGTFTVELLLSPLGPPGSRLTGRAGRWRVGSGLAVTGIAVPADRRAGDK